MAAYPIEGVSAVRAVRVATLRQAIVAIGFFALMYIVLIGLDPLGQRVKTIPFTGEGDIGRQIWYIVVFVAVAVAATPSRVYGHWIFPTSLLIGLAWCWLSVSWAIMPGISIRRLMLTTIVLSVVFRAIGSLGYERVLAVLRVVLALTIVLSYLSLFVTPFSVHLSNETVDTELIGNWRGVLPHKNYAGAVCALAIIVYVFDARRIPWLVRAAVIAAAAYFLARTNSKTSMGLLIVVLMIGLLYTRYNPAYRWLFAILAAIPAALAVALISTHWLELTAPLNRGDALTGRVQIWMAMLHFARDHWAFGSGFGSFWNIGPSSPIFEYGRGWVAGMATAHNGYIDLVTQVGVPGLVMIVFAIIVLPLIRILGTTSVARGSGALMLSMLMFCFGHNFTESSLFDRDAIVQVFLMISVALIGESTGRVRGVRQLAPPAARSRAASAGVHPGRAG